MQRLSTHCSICLLFDIFVLMTFVWRVQQQLYTTCINHVIRLAVYDAKNKTCSTWHQVLKWFKLQQEGVPAALSGLNIQ